MSLGSTQNKPREVYQPEVYSNYKFYNSKSSVDKTGLTFTFWKGLLKVTITPFKSAVQGEKNELDRDMALSIYLTPHKAMLFAEALKQFKADGGCYEYNVRTNKGLLGITNGKNIGENGVFILLRILDENTGSVISSAAYDIDSSNYELVGNYNSDTDYKAIPMPTVEIDMIVTLIDEYIKASANATAASVVQNLVYDFDKINNNFIKIAENLGVELFKGKSFSKDIPKRENSFSSNSNQSSSKDFNIEKVNADELESMLDLLS